MSDKYAVFHINGNPSKDLMGTAVIDSYKKANPEKKVVVVSNFPDIWLHNPNVFRVYRIGATPYFHEDYIKEKDSEIYAFDPYQTTDALHQRKHLIEIWSDLCKIKPTNSVPQIYLTQREKEVAWRLGKSNKPLFLIQPFETMPLFPNIISSWTKDLPVEIAQNVVREALQKGYRVIQFKNQNQPALEGVHLLNLNLRLALALIEFSDKRLFIDSFLQQAAVHFNKSSVVTWMTTNPVLHGYKMHKNILPRLDEILEKEVKEYSPLYDIGGKIYAKRINTVPAYSTETILKALEI